MEIKCPSCKKVNSDSRECVRCGCGLKILTTILQAAESEISVGKAKLLKGDFLEALEHAMRSWNLKKSSNAAKLAFLANVSTGEYEDALEWHCIMGNKERQQGLDVDKLP
ncbi:MAG: hypothetical protein ACC651_06470 [Candidatus Scalindua sp.]